MSLAARPGRRRWSTVCGCSATPTGSSGDLRRGGVRGGPPAASGTVCDRDRCGRGGRGRDGHDGCAARGLAGGAGLRPRRGRLRLLRLADGRGRAGPGLRRSGPPVLHRERAAHAGPHPGPARGPGAPHRHGPIPRCGLGRAGDARDVRRGLRRPSRLGAAAPAGWVRGAPVAQGFPARRAGAGMAGCQGTRRATGVAAFPQAAGTSRSPGRLATAMTTMEPRGADSSPQAQGDPGRRPRRQDALGSAGGPELVAREAAGLELDAGELPPRSRGVIGLLEENCTVCMLCARECPDWCIYIESHKQTAPAPEGGRPRVRNVLDRFAIDFSLCMYCGICIEVCPFDALFWSPEFEYAETDIRDLTHERDKLREWMWTVPAPPALDPGAEEPKEIAAAHKTAEKLAAAQAEPTEPAEPARPTEPEGGAS